MLFAWIYDNPVWLTSSVILGVGIGLAVLSLLVVRGLVSGELRHQHNDVTGSTIANISVVYAVLLAFIAVATWDSFEKANDLVATEASLIGRIARDAAGFGPEHGALLRRDLQDYVASVVDQEWPAQQEGSVSNAAAPALDALQNDVLTFMPSSMHDSVVMQEVFRCVNDLYAARRDRLEAAAGHVPNVVWWVILAGGAVTIGYTLLFGVRSLAVHIAMTVAFTLALSLVAILIVQLDYPFRGPVSASADPYLTVLSELRLPVTTSSEAKHTDKGASHASVGVTLSSLAGRWEQSVAYRLQVSGRADRLTPLVPLKACHVHLRDKTRSKFGDQRHPSNPLCSRGHLRPEPVHRPAADGQSGKLLHLARGGPGEAAI